MPKILTDEETARMAQFLFEVSTMRKIARAHRQPLLTNDLSDNIATHSFQTAVIGLVLANMEGADVSKVVLMCLTHDMGEARTGDQNWVNKRYVTVDESLVFKEQIGTLPFPWLVELCLEYQERTSPEALVAKDADVLCQVMLLKEYALQGNKEARVWLDGKTRQRPYAYLDRVKTVSGKALGRALYDEDPSSWWANLWTEKRR